MEAKVRDSLLSFFKDRNNEYISGQEISEALGCTRAAVWKKMEELRKSGYIFEAKARKGYKLIEVPDLITEREILPNLATKYFGKQLYFFEEIDSTQNTAQQLALDGAKEGTVILSEHQKVGRGRLGRTWYTDHRKAIAMSIILRPNVPLYQIPELTLIIAIAIVRAIKDSCGVEAQIKWPNDVLINGKKIAGVLTELNGEADGVNFIVVGIGMNINHDLNDFQGEIKDVATSIALEKGMKISRAKIIQNILFHLEEVYERYLAGGFVALKSEWEDYSCVLNQPIIAKSSQGLIYGKCVGVTDQGILLLKDSEGHVHSIITADIVVDKG